MPTEAQAVLLAKRAAARAALAELPPAGVIGLGTGSTAALFIEELGARVAAGAAYRGVPTSEASRRQAERLGIPLLSDDQPWEIDVTVDGADEVSDDLSLLKGGGGAHTREKIVNAASRRNVIVVDAGKRVRLLGETRAVPVEILVFGHGATLRHLARWGRPALRAARTDGGNLIADLATGPIGDPSGLERDVGTIPGVVSVGIFVRRADVVFVATSDGSATRLVEK